MIAFPNSDGHCRFLQIEFARMNNRLDWDDLRVVLAVAREGTLSGAARYLRVTHSTVFRRLAVIEQTLDVRFFERFRDGYVATPAGEAAALLGERFSDEIAQLERRLLGQDMRPTGIVRIATSNTIWPLVCDHLHEFRDRHPEIVPELTISNGMANLTRREADIAIRPVPELPEHLIARRITGIAHAPYASPDYLRQNNNPDLGSHRWIGLEDTATPTVIGRWLRQHVRSGNIALTVDELPALRDAACAGLGLAVLPCYLGDSDERLRRAAIILPDIPRSVLWLLTHDDLRRTARVRAVMDFFAAALSRHRALLEGECPFSEAIT
jgi:DNA-binding transcriptional LysR family regulator